MRAFERVINEFNYIFRYLLLDKQYLFNKNSN